MGRGAPAVRRCARGRLGELAAADFLFARGFVVLARNLRLGALELDVVARNGGLVAVVEVRVRGERSFERPFESVSAAKRARLLRAADLLWRERLAADPGVERVRIDVAAVTFEGARTRVDYVEGAVAG